MVEAIHDDHQRVHACTLAACRNEEITQSPRQWVLGIDGPHQFSV